MIDYTIWFTGSRSDAARRTCDSLMEELNDEYDRRGDEDEETDDQDS